MVVDYKIIFISALLLVLGSALFSPITHAVYINPPIKEVSPKSDYLLPYPGLLPDNPLYPLKAFRDRMISLFISNPLKKANFDLLQADKRMNASLYLFSQTKGKDDLVSQTISKGENYFGEGIVQLKQAKMQGESTSEPLKIFLKAAQKHDEVLIEMEGKASSSLKKDIQNDEKRVMDFQKTLVDMQAK